MFTPSLQINSIFSLFGLTACLMRENESDRLALLKFKSLIREDPLGLLDSWNDTVHFCEWHGITCNPSHGRVTVLNLQSFKLSGSISPHIGNLSFLMEINLTANKFTGEIPAGIGHLSRLETLALSSNSLQGVIPSNLCNCSALTVLRLANNNLAGEIPSELGTLAKLEVLSIHKNYLTGEIPSSIGNLSSLETISAAINHLCGSIPRSLGQLKRLHILAVGANNLSGTLPPSIFNVSTLTVIDFTENHSIHGSLPIDLFETLPNLRDIGLGANLISGPIPVSISNASNLARFWASDNELYGTVPSLAKLSKLRGLLIRNNNLGTGEVDDLDFLSSLVNASGLFRVEIGGNNFRGRLPVSISNFSTSLGHLDLEYNGISGNIPSGIGNLINLQYLNLRSNNISGIIPSSIGKLQKLVKLYLSGNQLTGDLIPSIGNLTRITDLMLSSNSLQGGIPSSLGLLQAVNILSLSSNSLIGSIPTEIFRLSSLSIFLGLSRNNLVGFLPAEVGNLKNLGALDVSENMLSGDIPGTLGACISLEQLHMEGNNFQGSIPSTLSSLKSLQRLDLSRNNLSGEIPRFLEGLDMLQMLNLSYNNFEGVVPSDGVFNNASVTFVTGNDKLCGGSAQLHLPGCPCQKRKPNLALKLVISIISALFGVSLLALFLFLCLFKRKRRELSSISSANQSLLALSYRSLVKATDGFFETNLIGVGAFGSVYRGVITEEEGKTIIAVKVLNLLKREAEKSFLAECEALRNIRHRNLVKVLTACPSIDSKGNDFKALVYEFMPNGSLEDWIHPNLEEGGREGGHGTLRDLSLLQRMNIAIDVACALEYLHHHCENPVVHCDLKPSNILLDVEMVAHVGDFGLARFIPQANNPRYTSQLSSMGIRGSTGYVAPEYGMGSETSTVGDVYSFGILLLELFTGKRPIDEMFNECLNLHNFAKKALSGHLEETVDPCYSRKVNILI
ncbi:hypothetical protein CRG98_040043 [Punica granatum]|uniref:non-specific serine/threonine protein kinase n=1 Tax=Punica granatum TaxID=22663 RepID=A0A2I0I6Y1_PUNGR|nr:hypothetical protein CRG98_040043 [Punica granatum]